MIKPQVKFNLVVMAILFIVSCNIAYQEFVASNWIGFTLSLCAAVVFYIGFVNTLMEID